MSTAPTRMQAGFQQQDIAQNLLIALSGSAQTTPNFWLNPNNDVSYPVTTQAPQYQIDSLQSLANIPLSGPGASRPWQILGSFGSVSRAAQDAVVSHYNVQPVIDIFGSPPGAISAVLPATSIASSRAAQRICQPARAWWFGARCNHAGVLRGARSGLAMAMVLVYLLMVVNFQSWVDPLIILSGLPGALAGILWLLFLTGTTVSVPALTGAIMCIGIATANSILLVTFARERLAAGVDPGRRLSMPARGAFVRF